MATKSIYWDATRRQITVIGGDDSDPVTFENVWQHFQDNPMSADYEMPRVLGGSPYELCEGNASDWSGLNGLGTPSDDYVDFNDNSASIKSTVSSVNMAPVSVPTIRPYANYFYFYMSSSDTAKFSLWDEVIAENCDLGGNLDFGGCHRITQITSSYIRTSRYNNQIYQPDIYVSGTYYSTTGFGSTVRKIHSFVFNLNATFTGEDDRVFSACFADKIKFAMKTNSAGSPSVVGIVIRNAPNDNATNTNSYYGAGSKIVNMPIGATWSDFELNIRDMKQVNERTHWGHVSKIHIVMDGLSVGDDVWLDGVRLVASDRNPEKLGDKHYKMNSPFRVDAQYSETVFKDKGFIMEYGLLDMHHPLGIQAWYLAANGTATWPNNKIWLGSVDQYYNNGEGGVFINNSHGFETIGQMYVHTVRFNNINFSNKSATYGVSLHNAHSCEFEGCSFNNMTNFFNSSGTILRNCVWGGGRYFIVYPTGVVTIENVTVYGATPYTIFMRNNLTYSPTAKALKVVNKAIASFIVLYTDSYGSIGDSLPIKLINLDVENCNNPRVYARSYAAAQGRHVRVQILFTFDIALAEQDGTPISNATVKLLDKNGAELFSVLTGIDGKITQQEVVVLFLEQFSGSVNEYLYYYLDTPDVDWAEHNAPFTLQVSAAGFYDYEQVILPNGYDRTDLIVKSGYDAQLAMLPSGVTGGFPNITKIEIEG